MVPLIPHNPLSTAATLAAAKTMLEIAYVDGVKPQEVELIRDFYADAAAQGDGPRFDALLAEAGRGLRVDASAFAETEHRELVVALCVMTGYADGPFTAAEMAAVRSVAEQFGVGEQRLGEIVAAVKDYMLAQLSRLPDAASVAKVARELG